MVRNKAEKPIFRGIVACVSGDLGRDWSEDDILRWIKQRDGTVVQQMDGSVTHLLCSMEDFKRKSSKVAYALKNLKKSCHIVTSDWLEDSIHKKRKLKETKYLLQTAFRAERAQNAKEIKALKAAQPKKQPENFVIKDLYHTYSDKTYFRYEVELVRVNPDHPENKKLNERYFLYLFESNAKPHSYAFAAKYLQKEGSHPLHMRSSSCDKKFDVAFQEFQDFFLKKTNIDWMARLAEAGTKGPRSFHYTPPTGGKPLGVVTGKYAKFICQPSVVDNAQAALGASSGGLDTEMQLDNIQVAPDAPDEHATTRLQPTQILVNSERSKATLEEMQCEIVDEIVQMLVDEAVKSTLEVDLPGTSDRILSSGIQTKKSSARIVEADNYRLQHMHTAQLPNLGVPRDEDSAMQEAEVIHHNQEDQIISINQVPIEVDGKPQEAKECAHPGIAEISETTPAANTGNVYLEVAPAILSPGSTGENTSEPGQFEDILAKSSIQHLAGSYPTLDGSRLEESTGVMYYTNSAW